MATVYLAEDLRHDRKVAIKVLKPELAAVLGADRFVQEIKTTAQLQHPHILPLHDSGTAAGFLFYVMPYTLFTGNFGTDRSGDQSWDIAPDGRFLMLRPVSGERIDLRVALNWIAEIRARLERAQ